MIIALFIFYILNYYTFAFDLPDWFKIVALLIQGGCVVVATAVWNKWKAEVETLRDEVDKLKKK